MIFANTIAGFKTEASNVTAKAYLENHGEN